MQTILRKSTIIGNEKWISQDITDEMKNKLTSNLSDEISNIEEIEDNISTKYHCDSKFLNSVPSSRITHLLKILKPKHKEKEKGEIKNVQIDFGNINYNSDMSLYEDYLHLLLIKTSDKFIQERYKDFMSKASQKKTKVSFFKRMENDIVQRGGIKGKDRQNKSEISIDGLKL